MACSGNSVVPPKRSPSSSDVGLWAAAQLFGETFLCTKPWLSAVLTWHDSTSLDIVGQIHASGLRMSWLIIAPSLAWFGHGFLQSNSSWRWPLVEVATWVGVLRV